MSGIALYNILKKIDGTTDEEIEKAVSDVARSKDVATKGDLKAGLAELKGEIEKSLRYTVMWLCGFIVANSAVIVALLK